MKFAISRMMCACLTAAVATVAQADLADLLAEADLKKGERVFKKCKARHTIDEGDRNKTGPNLFGVVGDDVAAREGFKYSKAMVAYGGSWNVERLDAFLTKPKAEIKSTKMSFAGLKKEADRINLIAYMNQFSANPLPFGAPEAPSQDHATSDTGSEQSEFGILKVAPGVEPTYYTCSACHSEMIVAQQGLTRDDWEEMLEWMVEEQGMSEIDEPDLSLILDYLSTHYNEDRPNFPVRN